MKNSDAPFQSGHRICLHNRLGRLGLDHNLLAKDHSLSSLSRWLLASLDLTNAWDDEFASTLHFLGGDRCKAANDLGADRLLQIILVASAAAISVLVIALALAFIAFIGAISTKEIVNEIFWDLLLWRVLSLAA